MITAKRAREIASEWHSGVLSGLYKIACNEDYSKLSVEDWRSAMEETKETMKDLQAYGVGYRDICELESLGHWISEHSAMAERKIDENEE